MGENSNDARHHSQETGFRALDAAPEFYEYVVLDGRWRREVVAIAIAVVGGVAIDGTVYFRMATLTLEQTLERPDSRAKHARLLNLNAIPFHHMLLSTVPNIGCFVIVCGRTG